MSMLAQTAAAYWALQKPRVSSQQARLPGQERRTGLPGLSRIPFARMVLWHSLNC